ncbi:MAG: phospholipase A [Azoarcus sp.]|nr:phospholipase A [Azoarcus sp.]
MVMRFVPNCAVLIVVLLCMPIPGRAQEVSPWLLATPDPRVKPGQSFELLVIDADMDADEKGKGKDGRENDGKRVWPARLPVFIELPAGQRLALELAAVGEGGHGRQRYLGEWPAEVLGIATLFPAGHERSRLIFEANVPTADTAAAAEMAAAENAASGIDAPGDLLPAHGNSVVEPTALGFHEPMYFVVGGDQPRAARYQISFRYRLFDDRGVVAENFPLVRGLYFGFTQTSLWDLDSDSKPFRDTSFRPSLYYQWKLSNPVLGDSLALAAGYEHESNGRDGADSRSINTLFVRADLRYHLGDGLTYIGVEPKVLTYFDKEDNPDITRYRGYGQLGLRFGRDDAWLLTAILRRGTAGVGSTQFDLSYPLRRSIFSGVGAFVHLQYFNGYGQTLLEYNESRRPQFRIGVSVVR